MVEHDLPVAAFLAGDLDPITASAIDAHLLRCDGCWLAVREDRAGRALAGLLRDPADRELADRIRLAVELAPPPRSARRSARRAGHRARAGAAAGLAAVVLFALLTVVALWPRPPGVRDSAAVDQVATLAAHLPTATAHRGSSASPVGAARMLHAGGQTITVRTWAFHGGTAVVADSTQRFMMPPDAHLPTGNAMPWTVVRGPVTIYCPHARVLLAGPEPAGELADLAAALHLS